MVRANAAGCWAPSSTSIKLDKLEPERLKRPPGAAAGINKALGREKQKHGRFRDKLRKKMVFFLKKKASLSFTPQCPGGRIIWKREEAKNFSSAE